MAEEIREQITVQGEGLTVSLIVWRRFRKPMPGLVERIYSINGGLGKLGAVLPLGATFLMPIPAPAPIEVLTPVRLWD